MILPLLERLSGGCENSHSADPRSIVVFVR